MDVKPAGRLRITVPHDRGECHLGNGFGKPRGEGVAERVPVRIRNSRRPCPFFEAVTDVVAIERRSRPARKEERTGVASRGQLSTAQDRQGYFVDRDEFLQCQK